MSKLKGKQITYIIISIIIVFIGVIGIYIIKNSMSKTVMSEVSELGTLSDINNDAKQPDSFLFADSIQKKVVQIDTPFGLGTGFLYNNKGDFITNAHVVDNTNNVNVIMQDKTVYKGIVIGRDIQKDVALIRVSDLAGLKPLKMQEEKIKLMDEVIAFGSPLGYQNSVTFGHISGLNRDIIIEKSIYENVYQTDAAISPGNSGGPLINKSTGQVIGINSCIDNRGENIAFSIPIPQVIKQIDKWASNPEIEEEEDTMCKIVKLYIYDYYDNINNQQYVEAYGMLGETMQKQTYTNFRKNYLNIYSVKIENLDSKRNEENRFEIVATLGLTLYEENGRTSKQIKKQFIIGLENDEYKIILEETIQ